ncbi:hypothetical protein V8F33_011129 [Rhypophila sp. PSN 637]
MKSDISKLVALATCLLFCASLDSNNNLEGHDVIPANNPATLNLSYLGMACGFFARLAAAGRDKGSFCVTASLLQLARRVNDRSPY